MPGFDGTGPSGTGPLTGKGRGFCVLPIRSSGVSPSSSRRPGGYRFSNFLRFGFGLRRGRGGRQRW